MSTELDIVNYIDGRLERTEEVLGDKIDRLADKRIEPLESRIRRMEVAIIIVIVIAALAVGAPSLIAGGLII